MSKVGVLGVLVALAGGVGIQSSEPPPEMQQVAMAKELVRISAGELEDWCQAKGEPADVTFRVDDGSATCAWLDRESGRVWHAAIYPRQVDVVLVDGSADAVQRLLHVELGPTDGVSIEGFPVWRVELAGGETFLALAEYEDLTLVRIKRTEPGLAVSVR